MPRCHNDQFRCSSIRMTSGKNEQKLHYLYVTYRYRLYPGMESDIGFLDSHKIENYWKI